MNEYLNLRTNLMNTKFGSDKCVGKHQNQNFCTELEIDTWKKELVENCDRKKYWKTGLLEERK